MNLDLAKIISLELALKEFQVANTIELLDDECTVPFIARYRKERTGSLDEVKIREVRDRYKYLFELEESKTKYLKVVKEHCQQKPELKGQYPSLESKFLACKTKQELEDLYLPFKPKRRTKAQIAREKGLDLLANKIIESANSIEDLAATASEFLKPDSGDQSGVTSIEEALKGASDILAEGLAETAEYRSLVRRISQDSGSLVSEPTSTIKAVLEDKKDDKKLKEKASKYENYFSYKEPIQTAPAHRVMAVRRGEVEKILKVGIQVDEESILKELRAKYISPLNPTPQVKNWLETVVDDAYKRLLSTSIETELRLLIKSKAEEEAIRVFSQNLENLLLLPPVPDQIVLGIDPGLRTGSKLAAVSKTGSLLEYTTIYPQFNKKGEKDDKPKTLKAKEEILRFIKEHKVNYIAIGNGTGGREISRLVVEVMKENDLKDVKRLFVNEAGASVYSTDAIAREEFPDLDPTIRSAVSIARRLQDPLAELVKIDPRSIGVGQYQHDVNVNKLRTSLEEVVESCVNRVGVNVNTASYSLLSYVSGVGPTLAKNIASFRDKIGGLSTREDLLKITGMGPKVFTQSAGFIRVPNSVHPLDNSGVHPESYHLVEKIAKDQNKELKELIANKKLVEAIPLETYVTEEIGMPTLEDISAELIKPGRDPRSDSQLIEFSDDVTEIEDLKIDMELKGTVTNVTNFGAFVDIGVHQDGLVHISELSNQFVKDPSTVVSVGDILDVRVIELDVPRRRISLSCKKKSQPTQSRRPAESRSDRRTSTPQRNGGQNRPNKPHRPKREPQPQFTMDDLLKKFNQ